MSNRHLIRVHSCSFVFIRGSKTPLHSCPFVVQKHPSNHVHSWFKNTPPIMPIRGSQTPLHWCSFVVQNSGTQGRRHPSTPTPLPCQGRGVPGGDLGLKPYPRRTHLIRIQTPSHSCRIRVHSWFQIPRIRVYSWFKNTPPFVSIRGSKTLLHSCPFVVQNSGNPRAPSPLTPGPSPLPGARGASGDLQCDRQHKAASCLVELKVGEIWAAGGVIRGSPRCIFPPLVC